MPICVDVWLDVMRLASRKGAANMNNIIYIVGLVVVVLFVAGYLGLR